MCCKEYIGHGQDRNNIKEHLNYPMYFKEEMKDISVIYNIINKQRCN